MKSQLLIVHARRFLAEPLKIAEGIWPRASVFLLRQSLEEILRRFWRRFSPGVEKASFNAQLICFPTYLHGYPELAHDVAWAWKTLSRAAHAHPYELAPTANEIRRWIEVVDKIEECVDSFLE